MKRILLFTACLFAGSAYCQGQIGNSDLEMWESVSGGGSEPVNWNSFLTATGTWSTFAQDQIEENTTNVRVGSPGSSCARIWSNNILGTIANGNMTLGKINMGSTTPTDALNYNFSATSDSEFSESLTDTPDSLVFWAQFNPVSGSDFGRVKATLHTNDDYRDPEDAASQAYVVATAEENFASTNAQWKRFAIAFDYSGPASANTHILITFTTNMTPGGGSGGDELYIDDIELIYGTTVPTDTDGDGVTDADEQADSTDPLDLCSFILGSQTMAPSATWEATDCDFDGVSNGDELLAGTDPLVELSELNNDGISVYFDANDELVFSSKEQIIGSYVIYTALGQKVQQGDISDKTSFKATSGIYFVHLVTDKKVYQFEIYRK
ncbi:MAG: T9SS type A sorting domain-containing protein [Crocinitomicaceae bacterium]|nr:T9SS type A sorting domain-containing protein [Crocinitomicaceae bacterium]